jgi:hypothetical protein
VSVKNIDPAGNIDIDSASCGDRSREQRLDSIYEEGHYRRPYIRVGFDEDTYILNRSVPREAVLRASSNGDENTSVATANLGSMDHHAAATWH